MSFLTIRSCTSLTNIKLRFPHNIHLIELVNRPGFQADLLSVKGKPHAVFHACFIFPSVIIFVLAVLVKLFMFQHIRRLWEDLTSVLNERHGSRYSTEQVVYYVAKYFLFSIALLIFDYLCSFFISGLFNDAIPAFFILVFVYDSHLIYLIDS